MKAFVSSALQYAVSLRPLNCRHASASRCKSADANRYRSFCSVSRSSAGEATPSLWNDLTNSKTIRNAVRSATHLFKQLGVAEPAASAEHLAVSSFGHVHTRKSALADITKPNVLELGKYVSLCKQREEKGVPIQYLVGNWDFHNVTLLVRPPVLIPRPETEELVEHVLREVEEEHARILDVGTGSGCIMLALLAARPGWSAMGIDIAKEAVELCCANVEMLNLADRTETLLGTIEDVDCAMKFDALVSNPPYIPDLDSDTVEQQVMDHEDHRALFGGGQDGMKIIRDILEAAPRLVKDGGSVWLEVDESQPRKLAEMKLNGLVCVNTFDDIYGRPRFCHFRVSRPRYADPN